MVSVNFMALSGPFKVVKTENFPDNVSALAAVKKYAEAAGFTQIKTADNDGDGWRYTARTPNGRHGRNVAFGEVAITEDFKG